MPELTERDILELVGDVDPLTIARLLDVGATRDELEAATLAPDDEAATPSAHLETLREILAELEAEEVAEPPSASPPASGAW